MSRLSPFALKVEDFPDFQGDRREKLIRALNRLGSEAGALLNHGLTFSDNFAAQVKDVTVRTRDEWIYPALANSWVNYGTGWPPAGYFKDASGLVHLRGLVKDGVVGAPIFTLPPGYRPAFTLQFAVESNNLFGQVSAGAGGDVVATVGSNVNLALDGISFRADDNASRAPNPVFPFYADLNLPGNRKPAHVLITRALDATGQVAVPVTCGTPAWTVSADPATGKWRLVLNDVPGLAPLRTYKLTLLILGG